MISQARVTDHGDATAPPNYIYDFDAFAEQLKLESRLTANDREGINSYARNLSSRGLPILLDGAFVERWLGFSEYMLYSISNSPRFHYRNYTVEKRSGGKRLISEPLPTLKSIQGQIKREILDKIPVSKAAHAYVSRSSAKKNARLHLRQKSILKMDVTDFFPSIDLLSVYKIFKLLGYTEEISSLLAGLCTINGGLPQGAPTSPALSNIFMKQFDEIMIASFVPQGRRYTRYADDITVSGDEVGSHDISFVAGELAKLGLAVNKKKTRIFRSGCAKIVTGILVNERMRVPADLRKSLRQEWYYVCKFGIWEHAQRKGEKPEQAIRRLNGQANYQRWVDPQDKSLGEICKGISAIQKDLINPTFGG